MADPIKARIDLKISRARKSDSSVENAFLFLETDKASRGGVESAARCGWLCGDGFVTTAYGTKDDFGKSLFVDQRAKATKKKLDSQHSSVFTQAAIDNITSEARDYYKTVQFDYYDYSISE